MKKLIFALVFMTAAVSFAGHSGGGGTVSDADLSALDTAYKAADSNLQSQVDGKVNVTNGVFQSTWTVRYTDTNSVVKLKTYSINPTNGMTQATTVNE